MDRGQEHTESDCRYDGKEGAEERTAEAILNIVGRATAELAVVVLLIYLCQRSLDKSAAGTEESNNPHPHNGPRSTEAYGRSHTDDIARSHTAREGHGESLERRDAWSLLVLSRTAKKQTDHLAKTPYLNKTGANREIECCYQTQRHQRGTPYPVVEGIHCRLKPITNSFHSVNDLKVQNYKFFVTSSNICIFAAEKNTI